MGLNPEKIIALRDEFRAARSCLKALLRRKIFTEEEERQAIFIVADLDHLEELVITRTSKSLGDDNV